MSIRRKIFCFGGVDALFTGVTTYKLADYMYCREPDPSFLETILQTLGLQKIPEPVCPTSYGVILVVVGWIVMQIIFVVFYRKKRVVKDTVVQSVQNSKSDTSDVSVASPIDAIGAPENVRASVSEGIIFFNEVESVDIGSVKKNVIERISNSEGIVSFNEIESVDIGRGVKKNVIERSSVSGGTVFFNEVASVYIGSVEKNAIESVSEGRIFFNEVEPVGIGNVEKNAIENVSEGRIFFNEVELVGIGNVEKNAIESVSEGIIFSNEIEPESTGSVEKNAIESVSEGRIFFNEVEPVGIGKVEETVVEDLSSSSDDTAGYASDDCNTDTDSEVESLWLESDRETSNASVSNIITKHDSEESPEKDLTIIREKDNQTESIQSANTKDDLEEIKVLNPSVALEQNVNVSRRDIDDYFEDNDDVEYASDFAEETTESDDEILWIQTKTSADEGNLNRNDRPEWSQTDLHCLDVGSVKEYRDPLTESGEEVAMRPDAVSLLQKLEETGVHLSCQNPTQNKLSAVQMKEKEGKPQSFHGMRSESDFGYTSDLSEDEMAQASGGSGSETDPELEAIWLSSLEVDANTRSSSTPETNVDVCRPSINEDFFDSKGYGKQKKDTNSEDELQLSSTSSESESKCTESSSSGVNSNMKGSWRRNFTEDIDPDDEYLVRYEKSDDSEDETDVLIKKRRLPTLADDFADQSRAPFESCAQTDTDIDLFKNVPKCIGCGSCFATWRFRKCAACRKPPKHPNICSNKKKKLRRK
ncbi:serine-aspartate repeat-containing protein F-like [Saccostrea cucullata]|uniref:serine-aspartate repeat-containing protein F-like n=1 Tax=Saccostrea cuccullata TaxID=36930 RepID=UPI002ED681E3